MTLLLLSYPYYLAVILMAGFNLSAKRLFFILYIGAAIGFFRLEYGYKTNCACALSGL
jgi:hypothetical protein